MGLDTSHDCFSGAYSAFGRWRDAVAEAAGYTVRKVDWGQGYLQETILIDWGHITNGALHGDWEATPDDPLIVLIAHSDCEGVIKPEQARPLADRLEALLPALDAKGEGVGHIAARGGFGGVTRRFIHGLRAAAEANENVEFY